MEFGEIETVFAKCASNQDDSNFRVYLRALVKYYEARISLKATEREIEANKRSGLRIETSLAYLKIYDGLADEAREGMRVAEKFIGAFTKAESDLEEVDTDAIPFAPGPAENVGPR